MENVKNNNVENKQVENKELDTKKFKKSSKLPILLSILKCALSFAIPFILGITMTKTSLNNSAQLRNDSFAYIAHYDYQFNNPSEDQINSLKENASVKDVTKYYLVDAFLGEERIKLESADNVELTDFSKDKLATSVSSSAGYRLYVGYDHAKRNKLEVGQEVTISEMKFVVDSLFYGVKNNKYYSPDLVKALKESFNQDIAFNAVNVALKDDNAKASFKTEYIDKYQPLGIKKNREAFATDEEYQDYLEEFNAKTYQDYVNESDNNPTQNKALLNQAASKSNEAFIHAGIASFSVLLVEIVVFVLMRNNIKKNIVKNGTKAASHTKKAIIISSCLGAVGLIIASIIIAPIASASMSAFMPIGAIYAAILPAFLPIGIGAAVIDCIVELLLIKSKK